MDGFPGNLKTFLTFSVTDDDGVSIDYRATTDKPTVCNLSHHVYFNLDGFPAENILNHVVWINADAITETDGKYGTYCRYIADRIAGEDESGGVVNDTWLKCWNTIPMR